MNRGLLPSGKRCLLSVVSWCSERGGASGFLCRMRHVVKRLSWRAATRCVRHIVQKGFHGVRRESAAMSRTFPGVPFCVRVTDFCRGADARGVSFAAQGIRGADFRNQRRVMRLFVYTSFIMECNSAVRRHVPPKGEGYGAPKQFCGGGADSLPRERKCPLAHST